MLKDELWMDIETGEIITASQAIKEFYKTHGALDAWTDFYKFTGEYADTYIGMPDFTNVLA